MAAVTIPAHQKGDSFVDHEARVRREHRGFAPVARCAAYGQIRQQQMMIDDDDVGLCRLSPGFEQEAIGERRTLRTLAKVRLGEELAGFRCSACRCSVSVTITCTYRRPGEM